LHGFRLFCRRASFVRLLLLLLLLLLQHDSASYAELGVNNI
jgi:hypothetical protein